MSLLLLVLLLQAEALPQPSPPAPTPRRETRKKNPGPPAAPPPTQAGSKPGKIKTLTFSGLDVEGKLKTPQLLYFLNRVRLELDLSGPGKRSFMPELERSADDKNF